MAGGARKGSGELSVGSWDNLVAFLPLGMSSLPPSVSPAGVCRKGMGRVIGEGGGKRTRGTPSPGTLKIPQSRAIGKSQPHRHSHVLTGPRAIRAASPIKESGDLKRKERAWFHICF